MEKIKKFIISLFVSFLIAMILLSLCAAIFTYTNINDRHLESFVFGVVMISVLIGSTILSRKIKEKGLLIGGIFGMIFCLIIYLITVILYKGFFISNMLGIYIAVSTLSGVIGGVIGVNV
ncbi:MAG: TIGR04086 family membrane protein [Clostridia bacterium]